MSVPIKATGKDPYVCSNLQSIGNVWYIPCDQYVVFLSVILYAGPPFSITTDILKSVYGKCLLLFPREFVYVVLLGDECAVEFLESREVTKIKTLMKLSIFNGALYLLAK